MLVFSSFSLISNIGILAAEAITGEPNEKEPTSNKETLPDNYEVKTILIVYFCVSSMSLQLTLT